jgi:hypothetical protein
LPLGSGDTDEVGGALEQRHEDLTFVVAAPALADVPHERLPAAAGKDVRAHLDGEEGPVLPPVRPLGSVLSSRREQRSAGRLEAGQVLGRDDVRDRHAHELVAPVAQHAARGPVDVREAPVEIGEKEGVGRELDEITPPRLGHPGGGARADHEVREVDDDAAVEREERGLRGGLRLGETSPYDEHVRAERQAQHRGADARPWPRPQGGDGDGPEQEHEGSARPGGGLEHEPEHERGADDRDREPVARHDAPRRRQSADRRSLDHTTKMLTAGACSSVPTTSFSRAVGPRLSPAAIAADQGDGVRLAWLPSSRA